MTVRIRKVVFMSFNDRQRKDRQTKDRQTKDRQAKDQGAYQHPAANSHYAVQPSGPMGDNPATAGPGPTKVHSNTPENRLGHINPSSPEDANTTPGTTNEK
jgi:hypothetical protein